MRTFRLLRTASLLALLVTLGEACAQDDSRKLGLRAPEPVGQSSERYSTAPVAWPANTAWLALTQAGTPITDPAGDAQGSRDIVGTTTSPAAYVYTDANHMYFRLRISASPLQSATKLAPFGWGCEFDTDANPQTYEFIAQANGIINGDGVQLSQNTVQQTLNSPSDKAEVLLATYSALTANVMFPGTTNPIPPHARAVVAGSTLGGGTDYFIDWAIDLNDFPATVDLVHNPFRLICGSSNNAQTLNADLISPTGATTLSALASDPLQCGATGCSSCITASACGPTCAACSGATPSCLPFVGCVQCATDADCASGDFCNTSAHTCAAKLANGAPMPTIAGHTPTLDGNCTSAAGAAVCAAGVCDSLDNRCGLANGQGPCTASNGATLCRSGVCDATDGKCGLANGDGPCTTADAATLCRSGSCSATNVCTAAGCTTDTDCASSQFCDTQASLCTLKLANGTQIPTVAGHTPALNGTCNPTVGAAVCASAVCDPTDNRCGYADGDASCTSANAATICRGGACSSTGKCTSTGSCLSDSDCSASQFCDTASATCVAKVGNGQPIPTIAGHSPALDGTCTTAEGAAACASGVCDTTDGRCGLANGDGACTNANGATVCRSGVCDADGKCGWAAGDGTCTAATGPTVCRSGVCNASGKCAASGTCAVDADCNAAQFCDTAQHACAPKLANGEPMPSISGHTPTLDGTCSPAAGAVACQAGVCDTADSKCGFANGDGTCDAESGGLVCRSGVCGGDGICGLPAGDPCTTDTTCRSGACIGGSCASGDAGLDAGVDGATADASSSDGSIPPPNGASVQGGGCSTSSGRGAGTTGSMGLAIGLAIALGAARRARGAR